MVLDMNGFSDHSNNEQLVSVLGSSLFSWMRDNRRMIHAWIDGWDKPVNPSGTSCNPKA
jgi:hypothetical protein